MNSTVDQKLIWDGKAVRPTISHDALVEGLNEGNLVGTLA